VGANPFTKHPQEIGESYFEHLRFAFASGLKLAGSGVACMIHAVFPFLFTDTAGNTVREMHRGIVKRAEAPNWERHPII
jgi:hypothetical protein